MAKAGVMLLDLQPQDREQAELDLGGVEDGNGITDPCRNNKSTARDAKLMGALDGLNHRFGKGTMKVASAGLKSDRQERVMRQERRTPRYTTDWADVPVVRA